MKFLHYFSLALIFTLFIVSCKDTSPQPSALVGNYVVSARLSDKTLNSTVIKDSIDLALSKVKEELQIAKEEMKREFDASAVDTSTLEGKLEYLAKSFGKEVADVGIDMSGEFSGLISDIATKGFDLSKNLLTKLKIDVELQADGDIKAKGSIGSLGLNNATWQVKGDQFIVSRSDSTEGTDIFDIIEKNDQGFILNKDELNIIFTKK